MLKEMMADAGSTLEDCSAAAAEGAKVRRKSKDLEDSLGACRSAAPPDCTPTHLPNPRVADQIVEASGQWQGLVRRSRRKSKDFGDDQLQSSFDVFDEDKSGFISRDELEKVRFAAARREPPHVCRVAHGGVR